MPCRNTRTRPGRSRVREAAPAFEPVYFNLTDAYQVQNKLGDAMNVLEAAAKRWPKDAEIYDAEGVIQIHAHALEDAIVSFERATKLAAKDPAGFFNLASAHHAVYLRFSLRLGRTMRSGRRPGSSWLPHASATSRSMPIIKALALKGWTCRKRSAASRRWDRSRGWRLEVRGWRLEVGGGRLEVRGWRS